VLPLRDPQPCFVSARPCERLNVLGLVSHDVARVRAAWSAQRIRSSPEAVICWVSSAGWRLSACSFSASDSHGGIPYANKERPIFERADRLRVTGDVAVVPEHSQVSSNA
jgi:hypothetical protein